MFCLHKLGLRWIWKRCFQDGQEDNTTRWVSVAKRNSSNDEWGSSHLGVNQPAVVERDVQQIKHDAFWGVLEDSHPCELHVHVQARLQLVQHCHGITHVLGDKQNNNNLSKLLFSPAWCRCYRGIKQISKRHVCLCSGNIIQNQKLCAMQLLSCLYLLHYSWLSAHSQQSWELSAIDFSTFTRNH